MMKFMINTVGKNIIFTDYDKDIKAVTFGLFGPYMMIYTDKEPDKLTEFQVFLEENGTAKMDKRIEELFTMRGMDGRLFECIGPYNEDGVITYSVNVNSIPTNPAKEGAILERLDWERNEKKYLERDIELSEKSEESDN